MEKMRDVQITSTFKFNWWTMERESSCKTNFKTLPVFFFFSAGWKERARLHIATITLKCIQKWTGARKPVQFLGLKIITTYSKLFSYCFDALLAAHRIIHSIHISTVWIKFFFAVVVVEWSIFWMFDILKKGKNGVEEILGEHEKCGDYLGNGKNTPSESQYQVHMKWVCREKKCICIISWFTLFFAAICIHSSAG